MAKKWEDVRPLTRSELELEMENILQEEEDGETQESSADASSDSEIEDNLQSVFSPSGSEFEPDTSGSESSDSEHSPQRKKKKFRTLPPVFLPSSSRTKQIDGIQEKQLQTVSETVLHLQQEGIGNGESNVEEHSQTVEQIGENADIALESEPESVGLPPSLKGKDGHRWCTVSNIRKRVAGRNVVHILQGPTEQAKYAETPLDVFKCLMTDSVFEKVLVHTNTQISLKSENYKFAKSTNSVTTMDELYALVGLLIFSGAQKDNHLNTREMFDSKISGSTYKATMSGERFDFLLHNLRFDDKATRAERKNLDRFAPIREIWDELISNCKSSYKPGSYVTIDEQLLAFRGRCPFRMYIPSKPAKYGIKIVMTCDAGTKYMLDAEPYLGKHTNTDGKPLGEYFVIKLTENIHGSNRNITMDNWFTSVNLADILVKPPYRLTVLGTLRQNKREIPPEMLHLKGREVGSSRFCFDQEKTLVSYKTKKNKSVLVLSTMHEGAVVCPTTKKPEIILHYNQTKGGVDTFDQMCGHRSCSRKTRRWPLCVFYGMLNIACINSWIIYNHNLKRSGQKPIARKTFMNTLQAQLTTAWLRKRSAIPTLQRSLKLLIGDILKIPSEDPSGGHPPENRTTCYFCPSKKRRMTSLHCNHCHRAFCAEHRARCCVTCDADK
nr:unnamed protein product [Callosobruchus analis]